ncbi:uncharacterized protein LOC129895689 [Solanum dulcamara]|uniref:uncharacterized protein LOC129895689 n=1 Tax=Solanum dulcamara TaxID=45834 RepID=UPI0024859532|nr:uncharacterized protein LOC129895689 [Solanum dulcamara]
MTWDEFASAFYDRFVPWSVKEESRLRFENLRQEGLTVAEYETRFYQLSRHAVAVLPDETERIRRFVRGLNYTIRTAVFRPAREGASFQSIVGAAKEAELMEREEFGDPKRARASGQFSGTSFGGKGSYRGGGSFQRRGPVHASMPASEDGQTPRGSYSTGQSYQGSQQRQMSRGSYTSSAGSSQRFSHGKVCYTCGDPDHLSWQCTSQGRGGTQPSSSVLVRGSAPPVRGRGRAQASRGGRTPGRGASGAIVPQGGGRGVGQVGGGRGAQCYAFPGRPEAEASDAVITVELDPDLTFEEEPIAILDRQVRKLRTKEIASVKVQWKHRSVGEATWETEADMRARYPQLFEASGTSFYFMFEDEHDF